jgi:hypothetical protein
MSTAEKCPSLPCREKYWEEMDDAQKIQALREAVVWMSRDLVDATKALASLGRHQHGADGSLLAPLYTNVGGNMNEGSYQRDYAARLKTPRER